MTIYGEPGLLIFAWASISSTRRLPASPGIYSWIRLEVASFLWAVPNEFWMLTIYAKAKRDDVPAHILKQLLEAFRNG